MKYNDNGEYKDIYVKSFDTLPVGTEVDFDGDSVPSGWEEVSGNTLVAYTLFNSTSGERGTVTLSDSSANYDYIEIFYANNSGVNGSSVKVYNPNGKNVVLMTIQAYLDGTTAVKEIRNNLRTISGNTISNIADRSGFVELRGTTVSGNVVTNNDVSTGLRILRVVGYKEA